MKKIFALALALLTVLTCLAACNREQTSPDPTDTTLAPVVMQDIDLAEYTIIRPDTAGQSVVSCASRMKTVLDEKLNASIALSTDWVKRGEEPDSSAKEILLGLTNRAESTEIYNQIEGIGYAIALRGNKIVIVASNNDALSTAVDYFVSQYVSSPNGAVIQLPEALCYFSEPMASVDIIKNGQSNYTVIRADDANKYIIEQAQTVRSAIESATGIAPNLSTDWIKKNTTPDSSTLEILVGETNRPESAEVKASLGINEYAVRVVGNKIVLIGSSATGIGKAVEAFTRLVNEAAGQKTDGKADLTLLAETAITGEANSNWLDDEVPAFTGGTFYGTLDSNSDTYEAYYTDTTLEAFEAYCKTLEDSGYTLYTKNEIAGNVYRTYTKDQKQIVHTYFVDYLDAVRVVVSPYSNGLPPIESTASEKVTEPSVTQMILDYETGTFGMCYIITLEDGSFIIFDGGGNSSTYDAQRLHETLQSLNKRSGKPVIAAWILTHVHWDHHSNFNAFANRYGSQYILEYAIHNAPAESYALSDGFDQYFNKTYMKTISCFDGDKKIVKAHTGMKFNLHGAEFEVLYSHEDCYPQEVKYFNNTTLVTRMTLAGQTFMWLGDVQLEGSAVLVDMYGDYLKSDFVQIAHHGVSNGGSQDLYKLIDADVALWPCEQWAYDTRHLQNSPAGYLFSSLNIIEHIVADGQTRTLVLPYTPTK